MKILDNNALSFAISKRVQFQDRYIITPDISDEQAAWGRSALPDQIVVFTKMGGLDEGLYLQHYQAVLNGYKSRSFYNMRGFGDVSILALLRTIKSSQQGQLPGLAGTVTVITSDRDLIEQIQAEFSDTVSEFNTKLVIENEAAHFAMI